MKPDGEHEEPDSGYARRLGQRIRALRRQQGLSLEAVEQRSGGEFKMSVLGAYERGDRILSVLRLQRLAQLYAAPIDQLLPRHADVADTLSLGSPITIDVPRLNALDTPEGEVLQRYISTLQIQRDDFTTEVTIRAEDVRSLGRIFERDELSMRQRLEELKVSKTAPSPRSAQMRLTPNRHVKLRETSTTERSREGKAEPE